MKTLLPNISRETVPVDNPEIRDPGQDPAKSVDLLTDVGDGGQVQPRDETGNELKTCDNKNYSFRESKLFVSEKGRRHVIYA